jgi:signal transduction histidine kinase
VTPRGNLFIKIFLGFWMVTVAVLASWLIGARYFESMPQATPRGNPEGPPPRFVRTLIYDLQNRPADELKTLLQDYREKHDIEIFLLRLDASDLYGRELLPGVAQVASQLHQRGRRRAFARGEDRQLLAHRIYRSELGPLDAVMVFKLPRQRLLSALGQFLWMRVALALLISALLCYALSRLMTNRIRQLQLASRSLADGALETRIAVRERGGDETDELARDFNSMASQIERQMEAQQRLLGDVSHELRSPLARLRIALALAQDDSGNSARHLQRIDQEAERLEELISQLLSARAEQTSLEVHIDLAGLLRELCADASFEGEPQGKRVQLSCAVEEAVVPSHGDLLKKTFENILRNAIKYTRENSVVYAQLTRENGHFVVRIEDQGPGVAESEIGKLFDEFYREDTARPRETGGYGLGLAIARRAIAGHHGTIRAENTKNGLAIIASLPAGSE